MRYLVILLCLAACSASMDAAQTDIADGSAQPDAKPVPEDPVMQRQIPCRSIGISDNYNNMGEVLSRTEHYAVDLGPEMPPGKLAVCGGYLRDHFEPRTTCDGVTVSCSVFNGQSRAPIRCFSTAPLINERDEFVVHCGSITSGDTDGDGVFETVYDNHADYVLVL